MLHSPGMTIDTTETRRPTLYTYYRSSCSWRVRIALNVKGVSYDPVYTNLLASEQMAPEFKARNPAMQLPVFVTANGESLTQSLSIIEFLEQQYPDAPRLLPTDPIERARVRACAAIIACDTQPLQNLRVLKHVAALVPGVPSEETKRDWARLWIACGLEVLEKELMTEYARRGLTSQLPRYAFGDTVGLLDVVLVPQMYNARRFGVDVEKYPRLCQLTNELEKLDSFRNAAAESQADFY